MVKQKLIYLVHVSSAVRCLTAAQNSFFSKFSIEFVIISQLFAEIDISPRNNANVLKLGN